MSGNSRTQQSRRGSGGGALPWIVVLALSHALAFQISSILSSSSIMNAANGVYSQASIASAGGGISDEAASIALSTTATTASAGPSPSRQTSLSIPGWDESNPLGIPQGQAQNLPSVRVQDEKVEAKRSIYGGSGDKQHLGGFTDIDLSGISPTIWSNLVQTVGIRSVIDVGCGRGISSLWFLKHKVDVLCVEGSHDAVEKSFLPAERIVEHDFSRGPWWPAKTYDMVWSVEFLEHVSRQYHFNYITVFRKAALLFVTSSRVGGWHHVEVHPDEWWIQKYESYGFRYSEKLTAQVKQWSREENGNTTLTAPNGKRYRAQHMGSMKVFVNPMVAALPRHAHLFPRDGCWKAYAPTEYGFRSYTRPCGSVEKNKHLETALPDNYIPLKVTPEMYQDWHDTIRSGIKVEEPAGEARNPM